jgi:hypothetical protein
MNPYESPVGVVEHRSEGLFRAVRIGAIGAVLISAALVADLVYIRHESRRNMYRDMSFLNVARDIIAQAIDLPRDI